MKKRRKKEKREGKGKKGRKKEGKGNGKNRTKKEGNYPFYISLFNTLYIDLGCIKSPQKIKRGGG